MARRKADAHPVEPAGPRSRSSPLVSPDRLINGLNGGAVREGASDPRSAPQISALSQRDPRWKDTLLGFSGSLTIGSDGCTLTCLTLTANCYGFEETPPALNERLKALGPGRGFLGPLIVWSGLPAALPGISLKAYMLCRNQPAPLDQINAFLASGKSVVVELDHSPAPGLQNHWVVLVEQHGDDYRMYDPWPWPADPNGASLLQRYGFSGSAEKIITAVVLYDGPVAAPPQPPAVPSFTVAVSDHPDVVASGGLALRDAPVNGAILARLPPGAQLSVLEPAEQAQPKVGVRGQWLNVRDDEWRAGYVAAWYTEVPPAVTPRQAIGLLSEQEVQPPLRHKPMRPKQQTRKSAPARPVAVVQERGRIPAKGAVLRAAPLGKELARLRAGARLEVLEPAGTARAKAGQRGQWIKVREPNGRVGYVAAQYVRM
jgi:hypothetical protein